MDVTNMHILVVDDDREYASKLSRALGEIGQVSTAHSEDEFRAVFRPYKYDVVVLDLRLRQEKEGLGLLTYIIEEDPLSVVLVISGYGDIPTAIEALQKGAKTFLEKAKVSPEEIVLRVEHALKESAQERRIRQLEGAQELDEIVGDDPKMIRVREQIDIAATNGETTVLVLGETGTGKELVARAIHRRGTRSEGPFVPIPLVEKHPETITSELFGHERGAFTGATGRRYGCFEEAHKGVLFLDEIGDLPQEIQIKLLRVLDQRTFRRMGGDRDITVDVQVVSATNRPLDEMIRHGRFREDLYYRLNPFEIRLPPLRERKGDIGLLANYFLNQYRKKGMTPAKVFAQDALDLMSDYLWRGNVRELQSVVMRISLACKLDGATKATESHVKPHLLSSDFIRQPQKSGIDVFRTLAEVEFELVENALRECGGKKTEAWKTLKYPDRFAMLRRVKRLLKDYPDIAEKYQEVIRNYA